MRKKKTKIAKSEFEKEKIVYIDVSNFNHCNFISSYLLQHFDSVNRIKISFVSLLKQYYVHECLSDNFLTRTIIHETSNDLIEIVIVSRNKLSNLKIQIVEERVHKRRQRRSKHRNSSKKTRQKKKII